MTAAGACVTSGAVVVTGAGQGIGRAIAGRTAGSDRRVWCADVDDAALEQTVQDLRAGGGTPVPSTVMSVIRSRYARHGLASTTTEPS